MAEFDDWENYLNKEIDTVPLLDIEHIVDPNRNLINVSYVSIRKETEQAYLFELDRLDGAIMTIWLPKACINQIWFNNKQFRIPNKVFDYYMNDAKVFSTKVLTAIQKVKHKVFSVSYQLQRL